MAAIPSEVEEKAEQKLAHPSTPLGLAKTQIKIALAQALNIKPPSPQKRKAFGLALKKYGNTASCFTLLLTAITGYAMPKLTWAIGGRFYNLWLQ